MISSACKPRVLYTIPELHSVTCLLTRKHYHPVTQYATSYGHSADEHLHHLLLQLQARTNSQTLNAVLPLHALVITIGSYARQPIFFNNNIMSLYLSFGELSKARKLFDRMSERNVVSYNTMITAYSHQWEVELAWDMFYGMRDCGFVPTQATFSSLLSCAALDTCRGCMLHALMLKNGLFHSDAYAGTALLVMFGRHECLKEAVCVFKELPRKSLITWNSMISLLGSHGFVEESMFLFQELMRSIYGFSGSTLVSLLSGLMCEKDLGLGEQLHGLAVKGGLDYEVSVSNTLLNMYVKCAGDELVAKMFRDMPLQDVVSYNTLIGAFAKGDRPERALELLLYMSTVGVSPNKTTYLTVITCCSNLGIPTYGEYIHAKVIRNRLGCDVFVGSALIDFYAKCGILDAAHCCFDEIYDKSVVSWNILIVAYSTKCCTTSISLFQEMCQSGYHPNEYTFSALLNTSLVFELQLLHCLTLKMGYYENEFVLSSLVTSYAKNGLMSEALIVATSFEMPLPVVASNTIAAIYSRAGHYEKSLEMLSVMDNPDTVSWNILLSACSHNGYDSEVLELFRDMLMAEVRYDNYTVVSILSACTNLKSLAFGSCVHGLLVKTNFGHYDTFVCNILLDMYAKCGCIGNSVKVFNETRDKNLITWTCLISALGHHGYAVEALERFRAMELQGIKPDGVTFVAVLSACRHGGLVEEGMELFSGIENASKVKPEMDHYRGAVDLLARSGRLKEAEQLIASMPFPPDALIWRSFFGGCRRQGIVNAF